MIPYIHLIRTNGLDAFLAHELEQSPMNMDKIISILQEMNYYELPQKIMVGNYYRDTVWVEYIYNATLERYNRISLDMDEDIQPKRKR